jgi:hypothetical protein
MFGRAIVPVPRNSTHVATSSVLVAYCVSKRRLLRPWHPPRSTGVEEQALERVWIEFSRAVDLSIFFHPTDDFTGNEVGDLQLREMADVVE